MIIGECPYDDCNEQMWNSYHAPGFQRLTCEKCGRVIWLFHSMLDPVAYTEDGFAEKYEIDEEAKSVKTK